MLDLVAIAKELMQWSKPSTKIRLTAGACPASYQAALQNADINLWRIPLKLSLAAVGLSATTLIPDILG